MIEIKKEDWLIVAIVSLFVVGIAIGHIWGFNSALESTTTYYEAIMNKSCYCWG